jgi:tmRNA-binding protein
LFIPIYASSWQSQYATIIPCQPLVDYKKARFNYEILETFEAGIELLGFEVKSLKNGQGSLDGAHVLVRGGEAFAVNMLVPPYQIKNTPVRIMSRVGTGSCS